jgi:hypothetical protein
MMSYSVRLLHAGNLLHSCWFRRECCRTNDRSIAVPPIVSAIACFFRRRLSVEELVKSIRSLAPKRFPPSFAASSQGATDEPSDHIKARRCSLYTRQFFDRVSRVFKIIRWHRTDRFNKSGQEKLLTRPYRRGHRRILCICYDSRAKV